MEPRVFIGPMNDGILWLFKRGGDNALRVLLIKVYALGVPMGFSPYNSEDQNLCFTGDI